MRVYNADKIHSKSESIIFKHLGTNPSVAANRIEGMFAHQAPIVVTHEGDVTVCDTFGIAIKTIGIDEHLLNFCKFVTQFSIYEYTIQTSRPLRLVDLWEDDPIGSAGPNVVDQTLISTSEKKEIQSLFSPFTDVIYPRDVYSALSKNDIKQIKNSYSGNALFEQEFKKRKTRSRAIGEDFRNAQFQEIVWLDYMLKLRSWALKRGYDSFVYSNTKEGDGSENYVTLLPGQLSSTKRAMTFLEEKYLREMPSRFRNMLIAKQHKPLEVTKHTLWVQKDPMVYWDYSAV